MKYAREFDGELVELFTLTTDEVKALYDYFIKRAGYISYEFDLPMIVLIKRLNQYIEDNKE
jgi:hypothetical protein